MHAIGLAAKMNRQIVITLSDPNIVNFFHDEIQNVINKNMDMIFCNEQEALNISKSNNIDEAITFLKKYTDKLIVTLGRKGVVYIDNHNMLKIDGHDVQSKDFTGAGDMFLGAFMHMFDEDKNNINESLTFANLCASKIIQVYGAKFDDKSEYQTLINRFNN
jgi:sugar/nucleoside kinase (ribokinase family)